MSTLSLTVLPAKTLKNGKNKVRIAVAHNSQTRYIVTDVTIDSPKEWKNGQIVKRGDAAYLNTKLRTMVNDVQLKIDKLGYTEGLSCAELITAINNVDRTQNRTLRSVFEEMMEVSTVKLNTKLLYETAYRSITRTFPDDIPVSRITPLMIKKYIKERQKDIRHATIQIHIMLFAKIFNYCQANRYTEFTILPTAKVIKHAPAVKQSWLKPDQVRFIRDFKGKKWCRKFSDMFMLSYYLGGINPIDMFKIDFRENHDHIKYIRTKTENVTKINPYVEFDVPDEAKVIIDRWIGEDGRLHVNKTGNSKCVTAWGTQFRNLTKMEGMSFYSARKSFAQHAFQLGISESVIDYILGHSLNAGAKSTIYSYIKVTPAMATAALRKVLDFIASDENFE